MTLSEAQPIRVLHLASHEINVGDGALNAVIRARLQALATRPIAFTLMDVAIDPPDLTAEMVDAFDLVIVGGGGAISNSPRAARTGTAMPMSLDEYRRSGVPFAFVALGHNIFASDRFQHGTALKQLLRAAKERGDPFSVRNDQSLLRLQRDLRGVVDPVIEIPDPGFFVHAPPLRPIEASDRPYMLIQVAGDSASMRTGAGKGRRLWWKVTGYDGMTAISRALAEFGLRMWRKHQLDILVAPHIHRDAAAAAAIVAQLYAAAGSSAAHRPFRMLGTPHPLHAERFFGSYAGAEFVVGMRGHAVVCGVGLRKPVVALSTHPKITGFMETCGLGEWSVSPSPHLLDELTEKSDSLFGSGLTRYFSTRDEAVAKFTERLDAFLAGILSRFTSVAPISSGQTTP